MRRTRPLIGITLGDPKGIGPEIVAKLLQESQLPLLGEVRIFGDETVLEAAKHCIAASPRNDCSGLRVPHSTLPDADAGRWSAQWVADGVKAALNEDIDALVTAPINKARWEQAAIPFPGHTEYLAHLSGQTMTGVSPLFIAPRWRVALVTGHVSIKNVSRLLTRERVVNVAQILHAYLRHMLAIERPRLACLGLNPHAGEGGLLGLEEEEAIAPAVAFLRERGVHIEGPFPADTYFTKNGSPAAHDAVLAMYHDQGLIPLKSHYFTETVQVTMGLPFIRVSVDHGTAEDIAWRGIADHRNLLAAVETAVQLVERKPL